MRTTSPDPSESGGLSPTLSDGTRPPVTSTWTPRFRPKLIFFSVDLIAVADYRGFQSMLPEQYRA